MIASALYEYLHNAKSAQQCTGQHLMVSNTHGALLSRQSRFWCWLPIMTPSEQQEQGWGQLLLMFPHATFATGTQRRPRCLKCHNQKEIPLKEDSVESELPSHPMPPPCDSAPAALWPSAPLALPDSVPISLHVDSAHPTRAADVTSKFCSLDPAAVKHTSSHW